LRSRFAAPSILSFRFTPARRMKKNDPPKRVVQGIAGTGQVAYQPYITPMESSDILMLALPPPTVEAIGPLTVWLKAWM